MPAGSALALDRDRFAALVTAAIAGHPRIELRREEVTEIPGEDRGRPRHRPAHLRGDVRPAPGAARGASTSTSTTPSPRSWRRRASTSTKLFWQSRYGKGEGEDYLNAPMDKEQYLAFHQAVTEAEVVAPARVREGGLLRGVPAHRGAGPARCGHPALRPHEAGGPARRRTAGAPGPWSSSGRRTWRRASSTSWASSRA